MSTLFCPNGHSERFVCEGGTRTSMSGSRNVLDGDGNVVERVRVNTATTAYRCLTCGERFTVKESCW